MADEWKERALSSVIDVKHGFAFPGEGIREEAPADILLTPGNFAIGGGFKGDKFKYFEGDAPEEFVLHEGDLLVTMTDLSKQSDTLGYPAFVPRSSGPRFLHNQRLGKVVIKPDAEADKRFLFYLLCTAEYRHEVLASATGTTVKHTSPGRILAYKARFPSCREQQAIACILGSLDDKIELNRRMNRTLEGMARAIFKSWFVDFDPVRAKAAGKPPPGLKPALANLFPDRFENSELGEIPKGWKVESIYKAANVIYGAPFSSKRFNTEGKGKPLVRIRDLADESPGVWTEEEHAKGYVIRPGDVVVGMDGEFRPHLWGGAEAWLNQRVCVFQPSPGFSAAFVRDAIAGPLMDVESTETATTVIHLGKADIDRFRAVVPHPAILKAFNSAAQPLYDRIVIAKHESRTLAALRDALLPKLISGELRVPDAERIAARAV